MKEESSPRHQYHVFAYQIEIHNESSKIVRLISREWHITDAYGRHRLVEGEGVVGEKPFIAPGETYRYISRCDFSTTVGQMAGYYYMEQKDNSRMIKVQIPDFVMVVPYVLN